MRFKALIIAAMASVMATAAHAQVVSTTVGTTYLAVVQTAVGGVCLTSTTQCVSPSIGIPLSNYATSADLATANGQIATQGTALSGLSTQAGAVSSQVVALNQRLAATNGFVASVGAMHDAIPDPGDRFALRVNTAAVNGVLAGGVSASANLGSGFRASVNYAGARGQNAVSAGLNFSFR